MLIDFDHPIVSSLVIPSIFVIFEIAFTLIVILGRIRKTASRSNQIGTSRPTVEKYIFSFSETINDKEITRHTDPMDIDCLCADIRSRRHRKPLNVRELPPAIERFNCGLQLACAGIAIQFNSIIIAATNSQGEKNVVGSGLVFLVVQIMFALLVGFMHRLSDPDNDGLKVRVFVHLVLANIVGFIALFLSFIYLTF